MSSGSPADKYLTYRGDLRAAAGAGGTVAFVTAHPEGRPTGLYRLDADKLTLAADDLPAGAVNVVAEPDGTLWLAGTDRRVYRAAAAGKPQPMKAPLEAAPVALALLSENRLAVLAGAQVVVLSRKDGSALQIIELPEPGTALAADPSGNWLVAGTNKGTAAVFDCEDKPQFLLGETAKLHEGAVTALLFEPDDLRFLSAGADGKLLSTHARGKLEPEDKGKGNNHSDSVAALIWAPGDRFLTGGRDSTIKSWPRAGGAKPATLKDGVAKVVGLTTVQVHTRTYLVAACEDNTLRLFPLDATGRLGDLSHRVHGATAWAKHELSQNEPTRRESALRALAADGDTASVEAVAEQIGRDADHALRLLATQLLSGSAHPRAAQLLEKPLLHPDEAVRVAALTGLRRHRGEQDLRPLDLALSADKPDVGRLAVQALEKLAAKDDQALARLTKALDAKTPEVRQAALTSLENVFDRKSPEADLVALTSKHADLRRLALVRLLQRKMLQDAKAQSALRRAGEDADPEVRRTAFLLSLHTRDALLKALRERDPELERQLVELETFGQDAKPDEKKAREKEPPKAKPTKGKSGGVAADRADLSESDYDPLLQATASRALDTCLRGARGLAVLGDERALGLLLQLSREQDASARAQVARALSALDDSRAAGRLRSLLFDADAAVRDAAFTALSRLHESDPLSAAEAGLSASFEDVRRRGLGAVIAAARGALPQGADDPAWRLLIRALNDAAPAVRTEAFKAALNLNLGGGGPNTLRFVLQSVHADVRREVLTEVMARSGPGTAPPGTEPWAWGLLLEFYNDPDPKLRQEAFEFATKKTKELQPLEAALRSRYADTRRRAVEALVKRHAKPAQALLATALADDDKDVRLPALDALIGDDVRAALRAALDSPHEDVHAKAAKALARHGDPAALRALVNLASAPEPKGQPPERVAEWAGLVETALDGFAELGNPDALPHILPLLDSPHAKVRKAAGWALAWSAMDAHPAALRQAMQHADPEVKYQAAYGLALGGEASAAPLVFSAEAGKVLPVKERLAAALALGPAGEDQLVAFLDHADDRPRTHATILLMLMELKNSGGVPSRCLSCLSAREPRVRLRAARGLDNFRDPDLFLSFVTGLFNERLGEDKKPWNIEARTVDDVAELVAFGSRQAKARTARLLGRLFKDEQGAWDRAWEVHAARYAGELTVRRKAAATRKPAAPQYTPHQLEELAFGAYVGLVREQGGSYAAKDRAGAGPQVMRARQAALTWVMELARRDPQFAKPAQAVFVQALGDPNGPVRTQAFEQLQALGMDAAALGAEALETGHTDLGVKGLELLSGGASAAKGQAVLETAMLTRTDNLATEAAKLLTPHRGPVAVASSALAAAHEPLRQHAVAWLAAEYEKSDGAKARLREALDSRYARVREAAALELARKRDPAAFGVLVKLLNEAADEPRQRRAVDALQQLGDPRTPGVLLDRLENDPAKTAGATLLINAAGTFRQTGVVDRLLGLMDKNAGWRLPAGNAVLTISGHHQRIDDPEDERTDRDWETKQFPRHDAVLAALLDKSVTLGAAERLGKLLPAARWSRGKDVDPALARLTAYPDDRLRQQAVEAIGWRLRKRGSSPDPLLRSLSHRDPTTQFLAAEGLAKAGRGEGMSVLLSAVDFLQDLSLRRRAVRALGELGDARALDALLRLANEDGHALQEEAAEAIGHLGRSAAADEIFKLLERLAKRPGGVAENALRGLRWLDTRAGWQLIRRRAQDKSFDYSGIAVELLGYNDDPATRDLLLRILASDDSAAGDAWRSARRLWGPDSLEPDYALLQSPDPGDPEDDNDIVADALRRISGRGDPARIFEILPKCQEDVADWLTPALLNRTPAPVKEAEAALGSPHPAVARVAAKVIGRAGAASHAAAAALAAALRHWRQAWDEQRRRVGRSQADDDDGWAQSLTPEMRGLLREVDRTGPPRGPGPTLQALLWAAGRVGAAQEELVAAAADHPGDAAYRPIRLDAIIALAAGKPTGPAAAALESAAFGDDPEARALAADVLARHDPGRAAQLAGRVLASDRVSFNRLANGVAAGKAGGAAASAISDVLRAAALKPHYLGFAVPHLVARGDVVALAAAAKDPDVPGQVRLGAVEALGKLAAEPAEAKLRAIATSEKEDEELRKAAWRALRRSKRARLKPARNPSAVA